MDEFFPRKNSTKTASQIIAEAKAAIYPDSIKQPPPCNSELGQRVLSTKRPFTPKQTDRSQLLNGGKSAAACRPFSKALMILEESEVEEDEANSSILKLAPPLKHSKSNNKRESLMKRSLSAGAKLPMLVSPGEIMTSSQQRQQFRRHLHALDDPRPKTVSGSRPASSCLKAINDHVDPLYGLIFDLQSSQDDATTSFSLEQVCQCQPEELQAHRKDLVQIVSRHLTSDNIRVLFPLGELLLLLTKDHGSRTLFVLAAKIIFKLARDDANDRLFLSRKTLELLLTSLGKYCPHRDSEAFIYAYGGLKFLTLNPRLNRFLSDTLGFLHLSVLHMRLICEPLEKKNEVANAQVMFQVTSCIRNLCNLGANGEKFAAHLDGQKMLLATINHFKQDVDVMCNVSRILSVLTASFEDIFEANCRGEQVVPPLFTILSGHHERRDIVVRVTFVLGNLAARSNEARMAIGQHPDTMTLLPSLLGHYLTNLEKVGGSCTKSHVSEDEAALDFGSTGSNEDTAIKIIRVFANASVDAETGSLLALNKAIVNQLLEAVSMNHQHLMLPTLATLNNLSYYPIVEQVEVYNRLRSLILSTDKQVAAEAARVIGNLSRRQDIRDCLYEDAFVSCTVHLLACDGDRGLVSALVGIVINLMSDGRQRSFFKDENGIRKCIDLLHFCLETRDWDLACLICQAIWNFCIDCDEMSEVVDPKHLIEMEDVVVYLLEAYNESSCDDDNEDDEQHRQLPGSEFCHVALSLLKRVLDESPRKVELLLND